VDDIFILIVNYKESTFTDLLWFYQGRHS